MNSVATLLEARALGRLAPGTQKWLLRNVTLTVLGGDRFAIVGPTGAGKTLLLRLLALVDPADTGEVLWEGNPIDARAVPEFRKHVMYLHQRPALVEGTVEDNLRLPYTFACHANRTFDRQQVAEILGQIARGADFLARSWRDLSGGEAQIVAIVRALQLNPTVLLLDEPTASLDSTSSEAIERLVSGWHTAGQAGRALIWVTHNEQQSARVADRVLRMSDGRLLEEP